MESCTNVPEVMKDRSNPGKIELFQALFSTARIFSTFLHPVVQIYEIHVFHMSPHNISFATFLFHCDRKTQQQTYDIAVRAQDGGSKQSPAYRLRIHVTDGLEAPQLSPSMSATVYEDQKVGYIVKRISPRVNNINYKYSILAGNTNEAFCINHAGVVTVAKPLDREKISSYILRVSVAVGNKVSNTTLTVSINDRNDDAPHFTKTVYSFDVSEAKGTLLIQCSLYSGDTLWTKVSVA